MGLEECGKITCTKSGKGFLITLEDRAIVQRFVVNRKALRELDEGKRSWIAVLRITGDERAQLEP